MWYVCGLNLDNKGLENILENFSIYSIFGKYKLCHRNITLGNNFQIF